MDELIYFFGRFHVLVAACASRCADARGRPGSSGALATFLRRAALAAGTGDAARVGRRCAGRVGHRRAGLHACERAGFRRRAVSIIIAGLGQHSRSSPVLIWAWRADAPTSFARVWPVGMLAIIALLVLTGHYGGALTHGPDYLTEFAPGSLRSHGAVAGNGARPKVTDVAEADIYLDVVAPLLTGKCSACHNEDKATRRAVVRRITPRYAKAASPAKPSRRAIRRAASCIGGSRCPDTADGYMPKNRKSPPSAAEIEVLRWWIEIGAPQTRIVGELRPPQTVASDLQTGARFVEFRSDNKRGDFEPFGHFAGRGFVQSSWVASLAHLCSQTRRRTRARWRRSRRSAVTGTRVFPASLLPHR